MNLNQLLTQLLAPLITTILGALGIWIQEWRQARDQRYQRKQMRDEVEETISFFQKWVQAQQTLCSPQEFEQVKANARIELDKAYQRLLEIHEPRTQLQVYPMFQRALLLYRPTRLLGWIAHALFYLLFAFFLFLCVGLVDPSNQPVEIVVWSVLFFLPVLIARAWAVEVDTHRPTPRAGASDTARVTSSSEASPLLSANKP